MDIKKPTQKQLDTIDLTIFKDNVEKSTHKDFFFKESGEHYKLLAYISTKLPNKATISDLGTYKGLSALASSYNKDVNVITYDINKNSVEPENINRNNITFKHQSIFYDIENISKTDFIFLDIDPHNGKLETNFIDQLAKTSYKGLVLCDDINLNSVMKIFWDGIKQPKEDWSDIGHYSGTGVVYFK